jgi:diaminohydroxyphosphoribosylaminopyrimidine deaminase/5-amino-6-(5-phosphoribosylamino)uracil reductase
MMDAPLAPGDRGWMRLALAEAECGRGAVEPNPLVGAVIVREGRVEGTGHHRKFGGPHAEVFALEAAGDRARGATLYVTLEPCCHHGKTPPCSEAVIKAGIARVVAAMRDPFPKVAGGGFEQLRAAGIAVEEGIEEREARRLNAPYLKRLATGRPYVIAKWAMSLDGRTAARTGDSRWISGEASRHLVHERRGRMDGILVGIGTAIADDPELTSRPPGPRAPVRIVLDGRARLPLEGKLVRTAREIPVLVAASESAPEERVRALEGVGVEVLRLPADGAGGIAVGALLDELGRRGMTNLLVEGGGRALGAFADAGEIDEVDGFIAPILVGGPAAYAPLFGEGAERIALATRVSGLRVEAVGEDLRVRGEVPRPWWASGAGP